MRNLLCKLKLHKWKVQVLDRFDGPGITDKRLCQRCGMSQVKNSGRWWFYGYTNPFGQYGIPKKVCAQLANRETTNP